MSQTLPRTSTVYCVLEDEHRDLEVAEAVAAGRFSYFGTTLALGTEPDWRSAALPPDEEWRIVWSKFYEGLDLAHAFCETGERRFLEAWERLVSSWIAQTPVGSDSSDVAARRVQNWLYAWQRFAASPAYEGLSGRLEHDLVQSIGAQTEFIRDHLTPARNHRTFELYTLFLVPLALPTLDRDGELVRFAIRALHDNLIADFGPDGVHCECSTHYHLLALRSFVGARENARRFGLRFPDGFDARLERACEFALHCHRPDGGLPALSDSDTGSYRALLGVAAALFDRDDFLYFATTGTLGVAPRRRHVGFPDGGYYVQRSGWGPDDRFLVFDCGPLGEGGHGHYDALSFEAAAGGRPLLVDPGRYTYAEGEPNWRRWFKGTAAHNTVTVDGLDQTPYRRRKPKGPVAEAQFLDRVRTPGLDVLRGEVRSPCYEALHTRRIIFVGDAYWLVEDRLEGERPHRYDVRFHLSPEASRAIEVARGIVRAPGLALVFADGREPRVEDGWYSPEYGVKVPAPVVSVSVDGVCSATFLTLIAPLAPGDAVPSLRRSSTDTRVVVEVTSERGRDVVAWDGAAVEWGRE